MRSIAFALGLWLVPGLAAAQDAVAVELNPTGLAGHDQPSLVVRARQALARIRLDVRGGGARVRRSAGPLSAGAAYAFDLPVKRPGVVHFQGKLYVRLPSGEKGSLPLSFDVELLGPLELSVAPEDVDLERRTLRLSVSRPVERVQVSLTSDQGTPLGTSEHAAEVGEDGKLVVRWEQDEGTVLRIALRVTDEAGYFAGMDLYPWRIEIPHQDVNFPTGEWTIPESEEPKLEAAREELAAAIAKYGRFVDSVQVFIAGHTDRVGDEASNQVLSEKRARSIGRWFRRHGLKVRIRYAGCGERLPRVETPDETPEPKNRRAAYIVAIEPPLLGGRPVRWRSL